MCAYRRVQRTFGACHHCNAHPRPGWQLHSAACSIRKLTGLLHLGEVFAKLTTSARKPEYLISAEFRLQKYPAKGSLNARTFATRRRGAAVKIGYARVSTQDQK